MTAPRARIAVIGSVNFDVAVRSDRFPAAGETVSGLGSSLSPGGKGANQAAQAGLLGAHVTFVARVGDDAFGAECVTSLEAAGVDTAHVVRSPGAATGIAVIWLDRSGENRIVIAPNANALLAADDVDAAATAIAASAAVVVQLEVPDSVVLRVAELANRHGVPLILNATPPRPLPPEVLGSTAWVVANAIEAEVLSGVAPRDDASLASATSAIRALGPGGVVITRGEAGAFVAGGAASGSVPAVAVEQVVDTTAAGDAFVGAFAVALAEGCDPLDAAGLGAAAGAVAVSRASALPSLGSRSEIDRIRLASGGVNV
jgi:ribokinase